MPERKKQSISFIHRENKLHLNYLEMGVIFKKKKKITLCLKELRLLSNISDMALAH